MSIWKKKKTLPKQLSGRIEDMFNAKINHFGRSIYDISNLKQNLRQQQSKHGHKHKHKNVEKMRNLLEKNVSKLNSPTYKELKLWKQFNIRKN